MKKYFLFISLVTLFSLVGTNSFAVGYKLNSKFAGEHTLESMKISPTLTLEEQIALADSIIPLLDKGKIKAPMTDLSFSGGLIQKTKEIKEKITNIPEEILTKLGHEIIRSELSSGDKVTYARKIEPSNDLLLATVSFAGLCKEASISIHEKDHPMTAHITESYLFCPGKDHSILISSLP